MLGILAFSGVASVRRLPAVVIGLITVQVGVDAILWQHPKLSWNDGSGTSALLRYIDRGTGLLSSYLPSLTAPIHFRTMAIIGCICMVWVVVTARLMRSLSLTTGAAVRWSPVES
jgi:hypothetical protein